MKTGTMWDRVYGPDLDSGNIPRMEKNAAARKSDVFLAACVKAGVEPTKRQSSKWNSKKGAAYKARAAKGE